MATIGRISHLAVALISTAILCFASACTNDDEDFADGRDTATVWLISPTPFSEDDGQVQLDLVAEVFDWPYTTPFEHTYLTGPGTGWNTRGYNSPNGQGGVDLSATLTAHGTTPLISSLKTSYVAHAQHYLSTKARPRGGPMSSSSNSV